MPIKYFMGILSVSDEFPSDILDGAIDIIVFFCSFGVISTGNNLTPASEVVVTGRRRETTQVQENKVERL